MAFLWFVVLFASHLTVFCLGLFLKVKEGIEIDRDALTILPKPNPQKPSVGIVKRPSPEKIRRKGTLAELDEKEMESLLDEITS